MTHNNRIQKLAILASERRRYFKLVHPQLSQRQRGGTMRMFYARSLRANRAASQALLY